MEIPTSMRALEQPTWNGPADMRLVTGAPVPSPGRHDVLIRVGAAGVNFADVMRARGAYHDGPRPPYIAGFEAAGEIVAVGQAVTGHAVGDHVIGTGYGAFADYMVLPAAGLAPVPPGWADEQALGMVLNWATALAALRPLGRLTAGETVLVHAAAGGVGQAAVRLGKHYGATVIGTASAGKHDAVRALGADHTVDHRTADLAAEVLDLTGGRGADLVLESVGGAVFRSSLTAARRVTGRIVVYGMAGGEATVTNRELNFVYPVQLTGLHIGSLATHAPALFARLVAELAALRVAGVYPPGQPTVYALPDGPRALTALAAGTTVGKLALRP
ncbi:NADPH:quinone oxidoreductase family protein [Phytohabitans sp. LJ34]|uniref:NADPH:quinone oxidoreductase family protein n=1 Tax=Phytohabitans sp. LJ34 TaxID=3452217 RepID=UPI003F8A2F87